MLSTLKTLLSPQELKLQGIDEILTKIDGLLPLAENAAMEARFLTSKLNAVSNEESLGTNAKTRRRIKRILQRLTETFPNVNLEEPWVEEPVAAASSSAEAAKNDATTTLRLLNLANSPHLVEKALNGLVGPVDGSKELPEWKALKEVLFKLLDDRYITNKNIRRRISRLIFVIADDSDRQLLSKLKEEAQTAQVKAAAKASEPVARPAPKVFIGGIPAKTTAASKAKVEPVAVSIAAPHPVTVSAPVPVSVPVQVKAFAVCLQELQAAKCTADVDNAITAVSAHSAGDLQVKQQVMERLQGLAEDAELVSNTKIKRKVQRLLKTLEDSITNNSNAVPIEETVPTSVPSAATVVPSGAASNSGSSIGDIVQRLKEVRTGEQLDAVLIAVDLRDIAPPAPTECAAGDRETAMEVDGAQSVCKPEQRRLLKRTIDEVLSQDAVSSSLNAKIRRRVSRITSVLADIEDEPANDARTAVEVAPNVGMSVATHAPAVPVAEMRKVPHILFVGNLSYEATAADVEAHLREVADLQGDVKVRLRTDPHTGLGRGVAFVEVEGSRELHQCIAGAHHSNMGGRIINVEKSCGGRNKEQRGQKIASKRSEQQRRSQEAVDAVLKDFEGKGVLQNVHQWGDTLKDAVYSHSPAYVNQVLTAYGKLSKQEQRIPTLVQMLANSLQQS